MIQNIHKKIILKSLLNLLLAMQTWLKHDNDNNNVNIWWDLAKSKILTIYRLLYFVITNNKIAAND